MRKIFFNLIFVFFLFIIVVNIEAAYVCKVTSVGSCISSGEIYKVDSNISRNCTSSATGVACVSATRTEKGCNLGGCVGKMWVSYIGTNGWIDYECETNASCSPTCTGCTSVSGCGAWGTCRLESDGWVQYRNCNTCTAFIPQGCTGGITAPFPDRQHCAVPTSTPVPNNPTAIPRPTATPVPVRPDYCKTASVNKAIMNPGETLIISSMSNTPVNGFFYAAKNLDNNPAGNDPKAICTGDGAVTLDCPKGGTPFIFSDPNNSIVVGKSLRQNGSTDTINPISFGRLFITDRSTGKQIKNIQFNAYFSLNGGQWSWPKENCVTYTKMAVTPPTPTTTISTGLLNSSSGLSCEQYCLQEENLHCASIGTDLAGTNGDFVYYNGNYARCYTVANYTCSHVLADLSAYNKTCAADAHSGYTIDSTAHTPQWTYCKCIGFVTIPTPTTPPDTCPKKAQGDANCDQAVNILDYEIWRQEFTGASTDKSADFDRNGSVTIVDYEIWRQGFVN